LRLTCSLHSSPRGKEIQPIVKITDIETLLVLEVQHIICSCERLETLRSQDIEKDMTGEVIMSKLPL